MMRLWVLLAALCASPGWAQEISVHSDIAYRAGTRGTLDIYAPKDAKDAPVIVFFHGGSWQWGHKRDYAMFGNTFAGHGFVTVVAHYRLYPQATFPTFVEDAAQAFAFMHAQAANYGGDASRMFVMGQSAGAHIAMLLALDNRYLVAAGGKPSWIRGSIGLAGPYAQMPLQHETHSLQAIFATAKKPDDVYPLTFAAGTHAPVFLASGDKDAIVPHASTVKLAEKLKSAGNPVEVKIYPGMDHAQIHQQMAMVKDSALIRDIVAFVRSHAAAR